MNIKENLKYRSTHRAIMNAVLELLGEKELKKISVAEVCRRIGVNRTTFYLHFKDVPDVLDKVTEEVNANVAQIMPAETPTREDFLRLFCHVRENSAFYSLLFRQGLPISVQSRLFPKHQPPLDLKIMEQRNIRSIDELEYWQAMFQAGLNALLHRWLERGCAEPPEEICELLMNVFAPFAV